MAFRILCIVAIIAAFSGGGIWHAPAAQAQFVPTATGLTLAPSNAAPQPGQQITVKAESYTADLNSASLIWIVDGKTVQSGTGITEITVTAPALGKKVTVQAVATSPEGYRLVNKIEIGSGDVDLIIEPQGYVPPFYKGKAPLAYQNRFTIVAMPRLADAAGRVYPASELVYQWKKDWKALQSDSGYGRQSLELVGDIIPRPYVISVSVSSRDGSAHAEKFITITPSSPSLLFYLVDPLYGPLFNKTEKSQVRIGNTRETSVLAVPFGFNKPAQGVGDLVFDWAVNNVSKPEFSSSQSLVLRTPASGGGSGTIHLQVRNQKDILQGVSGNFVVTFSAAKDAQDSPLFTQ